MKKPILFCILTFLISQMTFSQEYGWTDISVNIPTEADLSDVFFVSDNEGWVTSSSHAEIYHTTDGGGTFEVQTTQLTTNAIHMLNENEGYAGGASGFIYKTIDGGGNWDFYGTMGTNLADISFPPMSDTGYCCGINGNIWSIDNSGVTKMISGFPDTQTGISFPINSSYGKVCGGSIISTYANGIWGGAPNSYPSGGYNAIHMVDTLNGWAVGDGGIIIHTSNGLEWFEQTNPNQNQNTFFDLFFLEENNGWAIGSVGTIIHTTNGGVNWKVAGAGLTLNSLTGVYFTSPTNGYLVGNGKTLLKYTEVSGIGDGVEKLPFEISPNPAASGFSIQSAVFSQESATIEIMDLNGRKLIEKNIPIGGDKYELDVSQLKNGIYFCTISTQDKGSSQKLIIQK